MGNEKTTQTNLPQETQTPKHMVSVKDIKTDFFDPVVWGQMKGMAETFASSGAFPTTDNTAKIIVKLQAGREMGMTPIESVKSFYFVNGAINIFGAATMRRLREHGWMIEFKDEVDKCTATIRKGKEKYTDSLTFQEAEESGWTKTANGYLKPGWVKGANRKMKLRYGVVSMIIKTYVPEVLGSAVDIAEVAMDATPVAQAYEKQLVENGAQPATESVIATIKNMGGVLPDEVESGQRQLTKQEGADMIRALMEKKKKPTPTVDVKASQKVQEGEVVPEEKARQIEYKKTEKVVDKENPDLAE